MSDSAMTRVIAVRIEDELADLLNSLTNRSEFIRAAILARCILKCPLCAGRGAVAPEIANIFAPILRANRLVACGKCGVRETIPADLETVPDADSVRWKQFLNGGEFVCAGCHESSAASPM